MAVGAMICTAVACVFILIGILAYHKKEDRDDPSPISFNSFSTSLGTMFFAWGGSAMFPTIQVDMRQPEKFHLAVFISYILLLLFYIPVSIVGFSIYGSNVADNILLNLPQNFFRYAVEILITGHLATAFTIVLNPVFQGFEEFTRIPKKFCWQRAVIRSTIVLFLAFMAETLPHFGPILSFIGGSTVSILGFILPTICFVTIKFQSTRLIDERFINNIFRYKNSMKNFRRIFCLF
jgi:vesicular inhibitory amino acid transporter